MIHLIVGNTGSGKTTYAHKLRKETKGLIFSIDFWNKELFLADKTQKDGIEWMLERIQRSESVMINLIDQLEESNIDSILDLGLSKELHRKKFIDYAQSKGYEFQIHYLDIPKEIRQKRVQKRNQEKGNTFQFEVSEEDFEFMESWFEKPNESEMDNGITILL